jgi:hypothetical protein
MELKGLYAPHTSGTADFEQGADGDLAHLGELIDHDPDLAGWIII